MSKTIKYRQILSKYLTERTSYPNEYYPNYKDLIIVDEEQNHFIHIFTGWEKGEFFYDVLMHLSIEEDKVMIYENNTDVPLEEDLVQYGIEGEDILIKSKTPLEMV